MQISKNKTKISGIIVIVLMMASALPLFAYAPVAEAQLAAQQPSVTLPSGVTANVTATSIARISFRPRVVGFGQSVLVNMWIEATTLSASYKYFQAYRVTITKPDGTTDVITMDSYVADTTAWFEYTADQVGQWTIKLDFLGQYFPSGRYLNGYIVANSSGTNIAQSIYYQPSSDGPYGLVVQEQTVQAWPGVALPTEYWTRPVSPWNREWWSILGNFPSTGIVGGGPDWPADTNTYAQSRYGFLPYVQGPKSSHVVWKQQFNIGGLVGGTMGLQTIWESARVIYGHPRIVYSGRAYWPTTIVVDGQATNVWQCYDLRTGEVYWNRYPVNEVPTFINYDPGVAEIVEAVPHLATIYLGYIGGGRLIKYDPWTGAMVGNYSIAPLTTGTFYADPYVLSVYDMGAAAGSQRYRLVNWTIYGTTANLTTTTATRIASNITWPISSLPATVDFEAGIAVSASATQILSISLTTGQVLANITTGIGYATEGTPALADHGKFAQRYNDGHWHCWDMRTGAKLWASEVSSFPWGTFGTYGSCSYGGMIMSNQFDSVAALNWTTGKVVWSYKDPAGSPFETAMTFGNETVNPWHTCGQIADGVYYTTTAEHSADMPIKRGWRIHAINATNGEKLWSLVMAQSGSTDGSRVFQGAIADGYLAYSDAYTCTMYVVGKGKSATTVTASQKTIAKGETVLIEGTVLDQSPGQPGTPCVSKDSMTTQMEYIHIARPIDGTFHNEKITGVPVTLTAIDTHGNVVEIGKTTTNGYYGTFSYVWTPPNEDTYIVTASFSADDSYGSSSAATAVSVGPAPPEPPTQEPQQEIPDYTILFAAIIAAVVVAILIGVVNLAVHLRKHQ